MATAQVAGRMSRVPPLPIQGFVGHAVRDGTDKIMSRWRTYMMPSSVHRRE